MVDGEIVTLRKSLQSLASRCLDGNRSLGSRKHRLIKRCLFSTDLIFGIADFLHESIRKLNTNNPGFNTFFFKPPKSGGVIPIVLMPNHHNMKIEFDKQSIRRIYIHPTTRNQLRDQLPEEGQTLIHCSYVSKEMYVNGGWVNIYPTTILQSERGASITMIDAQSIPLAPQKYYFTKCGQLKQFTLLFPKIPADWQTFDLIEKTYSGDGFIVKQIAVNESGVYHVQLS